MKTVLLLCPLTSEATKWVEDNVNCADYQKMGQNVVVEHRYITDIVEAMQQEGFKYGEDFEVA